MLLQCHLVEQLQSAKEKSEAVRYSIDYLMSLQVSGPMPDDVDMSDHDEIAGDWTLTRFWLKGEALKVLRAAAAGEKVGDIDPAAQAWVFELANRFDLRVIINGPSFKDWTLDGAVPQRLLVSSETVHSTG